MNCEPTHTTHGMFDLTDRVAIVAGGAGYLGAALCRGLMAHGANVVVADINANNAENLAVELNDSQRTNRSLALGLDIGSEDSIRRVVDRVQTDFKRLDIVVNATFAPQQQSFEAISGAEFGRSLEINVAGAFLLARYAKQAMVRGGSMVLFSSMYGQVAPDPRIYLAPMRPNPIEYGAAKAGIEQMIRYLAVTWASDGVRVNGIVPGPFPQPHVIENHPDFVERLAQRVPLGRVGMAAEIAGAVVFLASDAASYVTGHCLCVDGGWTIW